MNSVQNKDDLTWDELIHLLLEKFESDSVNVEEIKDILASYKSSPADWKKFAKFDKYKYTRNLVHEGNGKFNLMILCWPEGQQSSIHDHANSHCFLKVLDGTLSEILYESPGNLSDKPIHVDIVESGRQDCKKNQVTYINDKIGLHRMGNPSHSDSSVTLHLYSPPFQSCGVFDERTGNRMTCPMTFWSKFGEKSCSKRTKANPKST
ncbi:cysteine dioxygenase type 1 isoform X2 [Lepeophtheirus salmonis]|uniref:Cysteine dioxygenase n=3 Tax=Lepeophtheirus salmonis TaxID=72036 RepID=D3PHY2_LEPSM|nr:cysteine dioxygenase type 1-like [Lepeophtheirus salmonis]XP_040566703.1 cysteine dioxygenase type 1-like [Lepeophtheirus salmonis]XP_040566704.1 cysteine dioxygenase type 1-like [Lepeophtheirus salmonis]XP_040566705.1 cysteine dioxygenase type 1-like [Lepeophtheirus salmonis]XP_040566706.1 cysteine dioxygenase type 1-like [Lepeophtheirus salmonis]ADD38168.1 Cysteine dioxygenase type 1 [Lepeophtheirus salmonis]ADD38833.1 Cysteine dioxygenase type 1 [Lepeophtheirus salmonis]